MEAMVPEEEGMPANEGPAMPARAGEPRAEGRAGRERRTGKAWPDRCVSGHRGTGEASGTDMSSAHTADMHTGAYAADVHATTTEMPAAEAAMAATAKTTPRESGRRSREHRGKCCCDKPCEKPVLHRKILLAVQR